MKLLLVAEIDAESRSEAEQALDAFRETARTSEHGLTIYQATEEDVRSIPPRFADEPVGDRQRYRIISDESSHYYLCPVELVDEVREHFVETARYWQKSGDWKDGSSEPPEEPDGFERVEQINGYSNVRFENPEVT